MQDLVMVLVMVLVVVLVLLLVVVVAAAALISTRTMWRVVVLPRVGHSRAAPYFWQKWTVLWLP